MLVKKEFRKYPQKQSSAKNNFPLNSRKKILQKCEDFVDRRHPQKFFPTEIPDINVVKNNKEQQALS